MGIFRKNKEPQMTGVDLSQVIRGMQHAVNEAQRTLEVHHLKSLLRFFYADGDPKSVDLHLGGTKHIDIPLVTLANHSSLKIDELEMEFKARIEEVAVKDLDELKQIICESGEPLGADGEDAAASATTKLDGTPPDEGSATFNIGFSSSAPHGVDAGNVISVRIKFLSADQPEGLSRIIDEYNKLVAPYDVHPSTDGSGDPPAFVFDDEPSSGQAESDDTDGQGADTEAVVTEPVPASESSEGMEQVLASDGNNPKGVRSTLTQDADASMEPSGDPKQGRRTPAKVRKKLKKGKNLHMTQLDD